MDYGPVEILLAVAALSFVLYYWLTSTYNHWRNLNIPGPEPQLLVGNFAPVFFRQTSVPERIHKLYNDWKNERFFGIFNSKMPLLIVNDLDLIKNILIKDFHIFYGRGIKINKELDPLTEHLFNIDGHRWKILRSKLTPVFTTGKLKRMIELIVVCAENFETFLHNQVGNGKVIECHEAAARFTTDVIGSCAFGIEMNGLSQTDSDFRRVGKQILAPTMSNLYKRMLRDFSPRLYKLLKMRQLSAEDTNFFVQSIRSTIEYREKENISRHDLVDILREIKKQQDQVDFELTEELLTAQAFVFFVAGFDTSSTTISFALYELAIAPEIQDKLRAEIKDSLEKNNGKFSYESINEMKYLNMVVQETLRKDGPASAVRRINIEPYKVPGTDVVLPKGTKVIIPTFSLHRDERYFPKPDVFDPERFADGEGKYGMAYLPFGDGPKNCIGMRFAAYQTKLGIISVIKNYKVSPSKFTQVPYKIDKSSIVLSSVGGIKLRLDPIKL